MASACFTITGPALTEILRNFILEGSWGSAYRILANDLGLDNPEKQIRKFFDFELKIEGSSETDDLHFVECVPPDDYRERIFDGFNTALDRIEDDDEDDDWLDHNKFSLKQILEHVEKNPESDFAYLFKVYDPEEFYSRIQLNIAKYLYPEDAFCPSHSSGIILPSGELFICSNEQHYRMIPTFRDLGILPYNNEMADEESIVKISFLQLTGHLGLSLGFGELDITEEQLNTLFELSQNYDLTKYGEGKTPVPFFLMKEICEREDFGGKWNNLTFLKRFYPDIKTPRISKEPFEGGACIRTSPKYSIPGLLNSKFHIDDFDNAIEEILADWEQHKEVIPGNELHWFYQEYLEGPNGVIHAWDGDTWEYSCSSNRGDIVNGRSENLDLDQKYEDELRAISTRLARGLGVPVQLEFVIHREEVYILQLRTLEPNTDWDELDEFQLPSEEDILVKGKCFHAGEALEVSKEDVLIVDSEAKSEDLIGKKALIVKNDVAFAHVLALSKVLDIPSIYGVGELQILPEKFWVIVSEKHGGVVFV